MSCIKTGANTVTVERCPCGHPVCKTYGVSNGTFYQGCGWDKDTAEFVAWCFNEEGVKKLWEFHQANYKIVDTRA